MKKATAVQIKQWKERHGEVFQVDVPMDDNGTIATAYFKKPTLQVISAAQKLIESDAIKGGNLILEECWLGGNEDIKSSDEARISAIKQVSLIFKVREATIKKL